MKTKLYIFISFLTITLVGCIENEDPTWKGAQLEFDAAIYNTPALGKTFPIVTRIPVHGRAVIASCPAMPAGCVVDPAITRNSGSITLYVNLIGSHRSNDETIDVSVVAEETTATAGVHYSIPSQITLPANSSFAEVPVTILNPGAATGSVVLVIQLDGNSQILPAENYKRVGISISQN